MRRRDLFRSTAALASTGIGVAAASPATADPRPSLRVHIVMFDGVEELDWAAPYEVFGAARGMDWPVELSLVTIDEPRVVTGSYGSRIEVSGRWTPEQADLLLVPGGGYRRPEDPGVRQEIEKGTLPKALAAAARPDLTIASVCTGAMLLSAAGLTKGRPCTTHAGAREDLASEGGNLIDARVVDDGNLVTAGGITSGLELCLWLIRREFGAERAVHMEPMLEYQPRGTVWQRNA